jgi:hypothetical protein
MTQPLQQRDEPRLDVAPPIQHLTGGPPRLHPSSPTAVRAYIYATARTNAVASDAAARLSRAIDACPWVSGRRDSVG